MSFRRAAFLLLVLTACNPRPGKEKPILSAGDTAQNYIDTFQTNVEALYRDTFQLNGQQVVRLRVGTRFNSLTTLAGDTIIAANDYYSDFKFLDINKDGYKDIRVFWMSNTSNECETWFFDRTDNSYKKIENTELDFQRLKGTKYYYAYNKAGCADLTWQSHLSKIENWKSIDIGLMNASGCGDEHDGIKIFKVRDSLRTLIERFSLPVFNNNGPNNKWAYLRNYWAKNYGKFE